MNSLLRIKFWWRGWKKKNFFSSLAPAANLLENDDNGYNRCRALGQLMYIRIDSLSFHLCANACMAGVPSTRTLTRMTQVTKNNKPTNQKPQPNGSSPPSAQSEASGYKSTFLQTLTELHRSEEALLWHYHSANQSACDSLGVSVD